jgi:type I restriction enzyme S subunit
MQVRRDGKIPVAILQKFQEAIISQAYPVFEVIDKRELLPEYLMMWFTRQEFDRESCFYAVGGVRGSLEWEDFCEMELPVPHVDKQREIVKEYNVLVDRINLNNQLIHKLEEAAQAIYKQWFVDFEFPDEKGKPYKSNGGEMEFSEELEQDIPKGWEGTKLKNIIENFDSKRKPVAGGDRLNQKKIYPYYGAASLMDYVDEYIFDGVYILLGEDGSVITENGTPVLQYVWGQFWVNNHAHVLKGKNGFDENSLYILLKNTNITDIITGGVQAKINQNNLNNILITKPDSLFMKNYNAVLKPIFELFKNKTSENQKLTDLTNILLSKLSTIEN